MLRRRLVPCLFLLAAVGSQPVAADSTYLALGDSVAFGALAPSTTSPSFGDQGYVKLYADWLGQTSGGVRPDVVNLALPSETTGSFFTGGIGEANLNLRYNAPYPTQAEMLTAELAAAHAAGDTIDHVTLQLGANDMLRLLLIPGFLGAPEVEQQARIDQEFDAIRGHYDTILTQLGHEAPGADVAVVGYYNAAIHPFLPLSLRDLLRRNTINLNSLLADRAHAHGARFVDIFTPFEDHEAEYIHVNELIPHPTAAGYAVIAGHLQTTAIPEPSSLVLLVATLPCVAQYRRRGRRNRPSIV